MKPNEADYLIYTDGSAKPNPGHGGWAAIIWARNHGLPRIREVGGYQPPMTTNNRMELVGAIMGLQQTVSGKVMVFSDSKYLVDGATLWMHNWAKRKPAWSKVLNPDLWQQISYLCSKMEISWRWVKGHDGVGGNERADQICDGFALRENQTLYEGPVETYPHLTLFRGYASPNKGTS